MKTKQNPKKLASKFLGNEREVSAYRIICVITEGALTPTEDVDCNQRKD